MVELRLRRGCYVMYFCNLWVLKLDIPSVLSVNSACVKMSLKHGHFY